MSEKYIRLTKLMLRPQGCTTEEACRELGISQSTYRGMVRDLRAVATVRTERLATDKRVAVHYIREPGGA